MNNFDKNTKTVIFLLIINLMIALLYFLWHLWKKDLKKGLMMTVLILLTPIAGPLYLAISALIYQLYFKNRKEILNIDELSFAREKVAFIEKGDLESALNKVPIEEALKISSAKNTRRLLLNLLKEDTAGYIQSINRATENRDSEVSHYAATAMTDIIDKFKKEEKILENNQKNHPEDEELAEIYWKHLSKFLQANVLASVEQKRYIKHLESLANRLEEGTSPLLTAEKYYELTDLNMELGLLDQAEYWVKQALLNKEEELYSYKAALKYYYEIQDFQEYKALLEELKASDIRLDHESLELVRFYSQS